MSLPVPLMFVSGPPVYIAEPVIGEESTSVFVLDKDEVIQLVDADLNESKEGNPVVDVDLNEIKEVDPLVNAKLRRIRTTFGQQIYRPLTFYFEEDEEISGNVANFDDNTIVIEVDGDKDTIVSIEVNTIHDVKWRGKSLPGN